VEVERPARDARRPDDALDLRRRDAHPPELRQRRLEEPIPRLEALPCPAGKGNRGGGARGHAG